MSDRPAFSYWRLFVGADGVSRQQRVEMTDFERKSIAPPAAPQWLAPAEHGVSGLVFTILPVGWTGEWHENPKAQWIVPLSGSWFVESMDGVRVEMGPGEISLGADQGCRAAGDKRGHRSGAVGEAPR